MSISSAQALRLRHFLAALRRLGLRVGRRVDKVRLGGVTFGGAGLFAAAAFFASGAAAHAIGGSGTRPLTSAITAAYSGPRVTSIRRSVR